jgi:hypothetical protein
MDDKTTPDPPVDNRWSASCFGSFFASAAVSSLLSFIPFITSESFSGFAPALVFGAVGCVVLLVKGRTLAALGAILGSWCGPAAAGFYALVRASSGGT